MLTVIIIKNQEIITMIININQVKMNSYSSVNVNFSKFLKV